MKFCCLSGACLVVVCIGPHDRVALNSYEVLK